MEKAKERAPGREPPTEVETATRVHGAPTRCPWCHDDCSAEDTAAVVCQRCLSRHHAGCWRDGGRCASCQGTSALGAVTPPREVAPAELALLRAGRVQDAIDRVASRLRTSPEEATRALVEAAARELAERPGERRLITGSMLVLMMLALMVSLMTVAIVFINVRFR